MAALRAGGLGLLVVVSMLVGGLITAQIVDDDDPAAAPAGSEGTPTPPASQPVVQTPADGNGGDVVAQPDEIQVTPFEDLPDLVDSVIDSVVEISVGNGEGSGVVLDTDGHILTNFHVIESGGRIIARLPDGSAAVAEVLGTDPSSDLAVLQADFDPAVLEPATLGDSDAVEVGDPVFAIGNPFSQESTVTSGIVSAIGRVTQSSFTQRSILNVIQTDAALNPGNSGGPLFNAAGEVIGINTSITGPEGFRGSVGLGFAVPSNVALRYLPQMLDGDEVQHAQLGVSAGGPNAFGGTVDEVLADDAGLSVTRGFLVGGVERAAEAAGVQPGDVIVAIEGVPIESFEDLAVEIDSHEVGDDIALTIVRGDSEIELTATLQAWVG